MVFRDSIIVIQQVNKLNENSNLDQTPIIQRIKKKQIGKFETVKFYHVKRHLNSKANDLANKGVSMDQGMLAQDNRSGILI